MVTDKPYRLKEAAVVLGVSKDTLKRLIKSGKIPGIQYDGVGPWYVDRDVVAEWRNKSTTKVEEPKVVVTRRHVTTTSEAIPREEWGSS